MHDNLNINNTYKVAGVTNNANMDHKLKKQNSYNSKMGDALGINLMAEDAAWLIKVCLYQHLKYLGLSNKWNIEAEFLRWHYLLLQGFNS